jgi:prophage maintenance system killer protein
MIAGVFSRCFRGGFKHARANVYLMAEVTVKRIIEIHDDIIQEYGGTGGLLIQGTLELLVYKVNRENDEFKQAMAENVLGEAGYYLGAEEDEIVNLMQKIAEYKCTVKAIEKWIRETTFGHHPIKIVSEALALNQRMELDLVDRTMPRVQRASPCKGISFHLGRITRVRQVDGSQDAQGNREVRQHQQ